MKKKMNNCNHKWKVLEQINGTYRPMFMFRKERIRTYILKCERCGDIKQINAELPDKNE